MTFDSHHRLILAILVLFLGRWVNRRTPWLREYGITEPVTGGLIASMVLTTWFVVTGMTGWAIRRQTGLVAARRRFRAVTAPYLHGHATVLVIAIAIAVSDELNDLLERFKGTLPKFVTALFSGMVLSNTVPRLLPRVGWPTGSAPLALIADVSLGPFPAMSLMTLNLASLACVALPLFAILAMVGAFFVDIANAIVLQAFVKVRSG